MIFFRNTVMIDLDFQKIVEHRKSRKIGFDIIKNIGELF